MAQVIGAFNQNEITPAFKRLVAFDDALDNLILIMTAEPFLYLLQISCVALAVILR